MFVARIASSETTRFERPEEVVLDGEVFERRLDHELAAAELRQVGRQLKPVERRVARVGFELSLVDLAGEKVRDPHARGLARVCLGIEPDGREARLDRELRDARAHCSEADDPDRANRAIRHSRSTTPAIAIPNPTHIDAIPYRAPRRSSSFTSVAVTRAPVAPSG